MKASKNAQPSARGIRNTPWDLKDKKVPFFQPVLFSSNVNASAVETPLLREATRSAAIAAMVAPTGTTVSGKHSKCRTRKELTVYGGVIERQTSDYLCRSRAAYAMRNNNSDHQAEGLPGIEYGIAVRTYINCCGYHLRTEK